MCLGVPTWEKFPHFFADVPYKDPYIRQIPSRLARCSLPFSTELSGNPNVPMLVKNCGVKFQLTGLIIKRRVVGLLTSSSPRFPPCPPWWPPDPLATSSRTPGSRMPGFSINSGSVWIYILMWWAVQKQKTKTKRQKFNKCPDGLGIIIMLRGKQAKSNCLTPGDFSFVAYFGGKVGSSFFPNTTDISLKSDLC